MGGYKMESYLLLISLLTFLLHGVVDGGLDKCGKDVGNLGKYTQVRVTNDGFCSQGASSCCTSWNGLVNPAMDTLFGKQIYDKFRDLSTLLRNLKQSITDLECHKRGSPSGSIHGDIVSSIDLLSEVNWSHILNSTFSGSSKCGMELTKLMYCSPNYCLHNKTVEQGEHFCHGHCTNIIRHCVTAPFAELVKDWKRAIGSLIASLRIFTTKTTCAVDKLKMDAHVVELNDWREPLYGVINSCSTSGLRHCWPAADPQFVLAAEAESSLVSRGEHQKKLQSISSSLEKHWQDPEGLSQGDDPEDPASVPSGSGWGMNEPYTDDEDLLENFPYGSGSGQPDAVPDPGYPGPDGTVTGSAGTLSPPTQPKHNDVDNEIEIDKKVAPPNNSGKKPASSSNSLSLSWVLVLVILPLASFLSTSSVKIT